MNCQSSLSSIPYQSEVKLAVRFSDVDMMRVVHHAAYLHFFETMRFALLRNFLRVEIERFFSAQVVCPVVDCQVKYLRSVTFGQEPIGYVRLWLLKNSSFAFDYWIAVGREICARGRTRHCFATAELELLLHPPEFFRNAIHVAREQYPDLIVEASTLEGLR